MILVGWTANRSTEGQSTCITVTNICGLLLVFVLAIFKIKLKIILVGWTSNRSREGQSTCTLFYLLWVVADICYWHYSTWSWYWSVGGKWGQLWLELKLVLPVVAEMPFRVVGWLDLLAFSNLDHFSHNTGSIWPLRELSTIDILFSY